MTNETIKKIMKDNCICSNEEAESCIDFVKELINAEVEHLEANEPYATNTINDLGKMYYRLSDLLDNLK